MTVEEDGVRPDQHTDAVGEGSSAAHRMWLEQLSEGIVIAQADPLRLVYVNRAMVEISGFTRDEMISLKPDEIVELVHPDDRPEFFERFRRRLDGENLPAHNEFRGIRKDGAVVWIAAHASRIEYEGNPAVLAVFTDITESKNVQQALEESEAKLSAQYKAIPVPTYTWQKEEEDFVFVDFNDAAFTFTKGKIVDLIGTTLREMYKDDPRIIDEMERCFREKKPIEREMEYHLRSTGETKYLAVKYAYAPPDLVIVHTDDITARRLAEKELRDYREHLEDRIEERTRELKELNERLNREIMERKKTEAELRESEARYRAIIEDQTEFVTRFKPDSTITFINEAACRYFGMTREELIGKRFFPMIAPEDRESVEGSIASLTREHPMTTHDQRTIVPDGEVKWQRWTSRAIFDENGDLIEYQGVGRDVTRRKEAEEALERRNRELGVLNEINNIINSSESSTVILHKILAVIAGFCDVRFAGLYEIDYKKAEMNLVASYGLPRVVTQKVERVDIVGSVLKVLESRKVLVLEEDMPELRSRIYRAMKRMLGFKKVIGFSSRFQEKVNFIVYMGSKQEEKFSVHQRRFLEVIGDQLGIALERFRLRNELERSRIQLKDLTASLIESSEEERRRMALSLHDDMGQSLVALNLEFDLLENRLLQSGEIDRARLREIRNRLADITHSTRQMSYALHPPMLEELGLVSALQRYIDRFITREGLKVDFKASGFDTKLPRQISITLYRVAQEALTNIVKHAKASNVVIRLTKGYPRVIMVIEDDGAGFVLKSVPASGGLGIVGMQERLERLDGDFSIHTNPGEGTRIRVTLPLEV